MMKIKLLSAAFILAMLFAACTTEVELCHGEHPHRSTILPSFTYLDNQQGIDSVMLLAVRNINLLKYGFRLKQSSDASQVSGQMLWPVALREDADNQGITHRIALHSGDYELVAFDGDADYVTSNLEQMVQAISPNLDSLYLAYIAYTTPAAHPSLRKYTDWASSNTYSGFIAGGDQRSLHIGRTTATVPHTEENPHTMSIPFVMKSLCQHVIITFDINKETGVVIDSIKAELSGIPAKYYILSGTIDLERTYKVLFTPQFPTANRDLTNVTARGEIWVTGIVRSAESTLMTGPGLLYINVYAHMETANKQIIHAPQIQACVNISHLLHEHPSLVSDGKGGFMQSSSELELTMQAPALLDIKNLMITSKDSIGIDVWHQMGAIGLDI